MFKMNKKIKGSKNLNVPNLRFPEFKKSYYQTTISKLATIVGGGTPDTTVQEYWNGGIQWFTPSEIGKKKYADKSERTISREGLSNSSAKLLPINTILLSTRATIGESSIAKVECCTNQGFQSLIANEKIVCYEYMYYLVATLKKELIRKSCGSTFLEISANEVRKIKTFVPSLDEQSKVSSLLSLIDDRIATQIKIIEDLKKLKSAICDKYFTYGNSIRLGDIGSFVRGLTYSSADIVDNNIGTAVLRSNNISNGEKVNLNELVWVNKTPGKDQLLKKNDIVICMANGSSSLVGKNSYYSDSEITSATVGAFCGIYRSNHPIAKWLLQSKHYKKSIHQSLQGGNGAIANVYPEDILSICFDIPCDNHIYSDMLENLECKLELEKSALGKLKSLKQYLLSQMFI